MMRHLIALIVLVLIAIALAWPALAKDRANIMLVWVGGVIFDHRVAASETDCGHAMIAWQEQWPELEPDYLQCVVIPAPTGAPMRSVIPVPAPRGE